MTREELFFKYACSCKDPNCSSVVKEKCSAEFFRDLDSVIAKETGECDPTEEKEFIERLHNNIMLTAEKIGQRVAEFSMERGQLSAEGLKQIKELVEERNTLNPNPNFAAENEFVESLEKQVNTLTLEKLDDLVLDWISEHGLCTYKNAKRIGEVLKKIKEREEVQQDV